ncbi:MAG: GntR family transcriptional regulator [Gammaproteobacteria bacterium]|nr:GntR family transcriptional regulator [Gammaproteobacteria bacterium]NIR83816.1 GntR family transcriptional regulator [Gammaproteobacteria bacterium]NIR88233.1 GntR family transcriptional regulator [Gammaproteobacteria bacterium]NIU05142.1 GntR family transcriptional regulator [Gammaproteobacteria bacterium]NIV51979.1 FCD domain-containing protein [Gammaproteobacteria bacterium]
MTARGKNSPTSDTVEPRPSKGTGAAYVYGELRNDILTLNLPPGENLDEARLVERFGMSRTPVREALIRLASDGLVTLLPNRGAMVASVDLVEFPRYVEALDLAQRAATCFAAMRRSPADLERIVAARDAFEAAIERGDALTMTACNRDFHVAIGEAAHNRYVADLYRRLLDEGMRMLRIPFAYDPTEENGVRLHRHRIVEEHRAIVDAIAEQDAARAESLAHAHAELFRSRFVQYLEQNLADRISSAAAMEIGS